MLMLLLHTLTMWGGHVASLAKFYLVVREEIVWQTNRQMDGGIHNIQVLY